MNQDLKMANELLDAEMECFLQLDEQVFLVGGPDVHDKHLYVLGSLNRYVKKYKDHRISVLFRTNIYKNLGIYFPKLNLNSRTRKCRLGRLNLYFDTIQSRGSGLREKYAVAIIYPAASMIQPDKDFKLINNLKSRVKKIILVTAQEQTFVGIERLEKVADRVFIREYVGENYFIK